MPITPRPTVVKGADAKDAEAFIKGAPDAGAAPVEGPKRTMKGKQVQFSHTMPPELMAALDAFAERNHLKRAPAINIAVRQMLEQGLVLQLRGTDQEGKP